MNFQLTGYAAYLPRYRLAGTDIGLPGGDRVVASFDEDSTTMAVAAAASALDGKTPPPAVYFATSSPAYADKTNAAAIHSALGLRPDTFVADLCGTSRSAIAGWRCAAAGGGLVVAADVKVGRPGSTDERSCGDGAAALLFGADLAIAEVIATTAQTAEFLDRWREPTSITGAHWEERFGAERYAALIRTTVDRILDDTQLCGIDHVVLSCPNTAIVKRASTLVKGRKTVNTSPIGFAGACEPAITLCNVLDVAAPGETILVLSAADGCDAVLWRTTEELPRARQIHLVGKQRANGIPVNHLTYLSWRGLVELDGPRRPESDPPAAPPAARSRQWKFGFTGTRCVECLFVHLPPARICHRCGRADRMSPAPVATLRGTVATYTIDRLASSPSPPVAQAVIDVDGGGRCTLEVADAEADRLRIGARVGFTFRRMSKAGGVHNYFWKARLLDEGISS